MKLWTQITFFGFSFFSGLSSEAIEIRAYEPNRHDRFVNFPSDLTENEDFYLNDEDWSGFGWVVEDPRRHLTMISPKHFVGAAHFRPQVGQRLRFRDREGVTRTYTVAALHSTLNDESPRTTSDLFVGELSAPIPSEDRISTVPILNLTSDVAYIGLDIFASGRRSRTGVGTIARVFDFGGEPGSAARRTRGFSFIYREPGNGSDQCFFESGDSGGPSTVLLDDGFALVGTHSALQTSTFGPRITRANLGAFLPHFIDQLDEILAEDGYHVTRANPTTPDLDMTLAESVDPAESSQGVSYTLTVNNSALGEEAHNLRLDLTCSGGATFDSATGADWVVENEGTTLRILRGGLASESTSTVVVNVSLPDEPVEAVTLQASLSVDGGPQIVLSESTDVAQSYQSWSQNLLLTDLEADPDGDGLSNLLEYAFGLNGAVADREHPLQLAFTDQGVLLSYPERQFAEVLGLNLTLLTSTDLVEWTEILIEDSVELEDDYLRVERSSLQLRDEKEFYKIEVSFGEESP